jgi:tetratricopeptide (TPR) repeat protein
MPEPTGEPTLTQSVPFFDDDDRFKQLVSVVIALVTVLTAIIGLLQNDAGSRNDRANRIAQDYGLQALGQRISGIIQAGYDRGDAYRNWNELDTLALAAENIEDEAAARRYQAVAERITQLSPLLTPTYLDPTSGEPNIAKYEADTYLVTVTALAERAAAWFVVEQSWGEKANTYVVHLTILAVSLFLFGLATTMSGRVRWIFVGSGLLITLIAVGWAIGVFLTPVPELPEKAIDAYARGVGLAHQNDFGSAVVAFDEALSLAPQYANAFFERGSTHYNLGEYQAAVADFEAARMSGRDDASVAWNLGWLYYLQGRFAESIQTNRRTIEQDPTRLESRFDLALTLLVSGQIEAAKAEYAQTLTLAAEQVAAARAANKQPPASVWWSLDTAAASLDGLLDRFEGIEFSWWAETPPLDTLGADQEALKAAATELVGQIRGNNVALEYTAQPLTGTLTGKISPFEFAGDIEYDEAGEVVNYTVTDSFPSGTDEVLVVFDYEGLQDGQEVVMKVYYNGEEDPSWRTVYEWDLGQAGEEAYIPLSYAYSNVYILSSGEYLVELYLDSHLAQRGYFIIEE